MKCAKCGTRLEKDEYIHEPFTFYGTAFGSGSWSWTTCSHEVQYEDGEYEAMVEQLASDFHDTYEQLAPMMGYTTRKESAVPWKDVPPVNANLMRAVCRVLLEKGEISVKLRHVLPDGKLRNAYDGVQSGDGDRTGTE